MCNATFARVLMVPVVVLCVAAPVAAADPPKDEIGISYSVLHLPGGTFPLGWVFAVDHNVTKSMAIVGEVDGNYKRITELGHAETMKDHAVLGGIKITSRANPSVAPFVQILAGISNVGTETLNFDVWGTSLTFQPGAGVDIRIGAKAALRLQGDYRKHGLYGSHGFRAAGGLVFGSGKR